MSETYVINIGRQLGSGGKQIGERLANELGIRFYDKELIYQAAKESGLNPELFEKSDEQKNRFRAFFTNFIPFIGTGDIYGNSVSEESLFSLLSKTIQRLAAQESCVIIGRCSEYILRKKPACVNIFICADDKDRVARIADIKKTTLQAARKIAEHVDDRRASFHDFYSSGMWGEAANYHLCINSSVLGIDGTVEFLLAFIRRRLSL